MAGDSFIDEIPDANLTLEGDSEGAEFIPLDDLKTAFDNVEKSETENPIDMDYGAGDSPKDEPSAPPEMDMATFNVAIFGLVSALGGIATRRTNTDPLTPQETKALADATIMVVDQYDVGGVISPKAAAWIGLGMVSLSIIQPRAAAKNAPPDADDVVYVEPE